MFTGVKVAVLILGMAAFAQAAVPEVDPGSAGSALVLLAGAALMLRGRRSSGR